MCSINSKAIDLIVINDEEDEELPTNSFSGPINQVHPQDQTVYQKFYGKFYFTKIESQITYPGSSFVPDISIKELLQPADSQLRALVQFNFQVDLDWLMGNLKEEDRFRVPVTIYHGHREEQSIRALEMQAKYYPNVKLYRPYLPIQFGTHHTKMMIIFLADDSMRIVVHTANLHQMDWGLKTQAVWVSPKFPLSEVANNDDNQFSSTIIRYLEAYGPMTAKLLSKLKLFDMSKCKAYLIASVPGRHKDTMNLWGHLQLKQIIGSRPRKEFLDLNTAETRQSSYQIIAQASSIGSLGKTPDSWLSGEFLKSLSSHNRNDYSSQKCLKLVFPSAENVRTSLEGYDAGLSIPYDINTHRKQAYVRNFLHSWQANASRRTRAMPHVKTFCQLSRGDTIDWFLLTSANISKAAWGCFEKKCTQLMIRSYELGVLIFPETIGEYRLKLAAPGIQNKNIGESNFIPIPIAYDIPLRPYSDDDEPWTVNGEHKKPDSFGRTFCY